MSDCKSRDEELKFHPSHKTGGNWLHNNLCSHSPLLADPCGEMVWQDVVVLAEGLGMEACFYFFPSPLTYASPHFPLSWPVSFTLTPVLWGDETKWSTWFDMFLNHKKSTPELNMSCRSKIRLNWKLWWFCWFNRWNYCKLCEASVAHFFYLKMVVRFPLGT